ncbi:MAG: multiheme c-type cytochrome [Nannocystaceae bacterium]
MSGVVARWGLPAALGLWCGLAATTSVAAPTQPGQLINELNAPVTCELCHGSENALPQFEDPDYTPLRTWQGTLMANAARDPVFWAGIAVADADSPGDTELCVRCHAPRAWLEGNGAATSIDQLTSDQRQGVECELCHRMEDDGVTPAGNAQYVVDDVLVGPNVPRRGPWSYPNADAVPEPPHSWIADTYLGSSRFCGTCHDVTTSAERIDDAGNGMGVPFNEQRTYSEWLNSAYAQPGPSFASCQDCHMPAVEDKPGCTAHLNQYSHATGGRRHDLVGANRFMVELLRNEYGSSGANLIADFFFDNTIAAIDEFLPTAATLEVEGPAEVDLREGLSGLAVTVTNESGHKLPSGYSEGRIMWIEVLAEYDGQPIYSSGAWDQAAGMQEDPQLRTYEARAERWSDGIEFHLLLNDHWVTDTRIPPRGLLPDLETDPVGDRYALLPDGTWPNYDQHSYEFPAADEVADATPADPDDDRLEVTVRLRYLINTPEYIDFLANEAGEAGVHVATLFDLAGGAPPVTIREQTLSIPIVGFGSVAETGTGTEGSTGSTTTAATGSADTTAGTSVGTGMGPGATTELPPGGTAATEDAEGGAADGGGEGCSCRSASGGSGPGSLVLLPWLLLGLRRRRQLAP